jgi:hypothetical protein
MDEACSNTRRNEKLVENSYLEYLKSENFFENLGVINGLY